MNFVVDASVALAWCFDDEGGDYAIAVLDSLHSNEAIVASHWPLEVTNGLLSAERRNRISGPAAAEAARLLLSLPIVVDPVARRRAFEVTHSLARKHNLTTYAAAYLELSVRMHAPIATLDDPLKRAAESEGVAAYEPDRDVTARLNEVHTNVASGVDAALRKAQARTLKSSE